MHTSRPVKAILALFVAAAAMLLVVPSANAAGYPGGAALVVNNPAPVCGATVQLTGTGFLPNAPVTLTIDGAVIGTTTTDAQGNFTFPYTSSCTQVGDLVITATDGTNVLSVTLKVSAAGAQGTTGSTGTTGASTLPRTGTDTGLFVRVGVLMVAAGGILVLVARKRSAKTAHTNL